MKRLRALAVAALLFALLPVSGARAATIWIWPGSAPCNTTLQACLDNAASGDEVLIAQNGLINEQDSITDKSLTLRPQTGFAPEISALIVRTIATATPVDVLVSHVKVAHTLFVLLNVASGNVVTLDHVTAQSSGADPGIYGIISFASTVNVLHSSVTQAGFYPGIELASNNGNQQDQHWNVLGNRINGRLASMTQAGVLLSVTDAGVLHANVDDNVITNVGQGVNSGNHGGIVLFSRDSGNADINVVGNTLDDIHGAGVTAENELKEPSRFAVDLFDDIIVNTSGAAVRLLNDPGSTAPFVLHGGHNDLFANGAPNKLAGTSIGPHLMVAPRFVNPGAGNLGLKASSPLIDRGATCSPGGVAGPDAAGLNRLFGPAVDIGAYEWNAGPPGVVEVGTGAPDTLTGGPRADILCGGRGNDKLFGNGGPDYLDGSRGSDRLHGGPGRDRLFGDEGNDLICATDGQPGDHLDGGKGTDAYRADPGDTKVSVERLGRCAT